MSVRQPAWLVRNISITLKSDIVILDGQHWSTFIDFPNIRNNFSITQIYQNVYNLPWTILNLE